MRLNKIALASLVLGASALLAACGGDSGGSLGGGSTLSLNGTAATGKALVGAVSANCKVGTGASTSNPDGSFTVLVNNGVGPCLLSITAGTTTLYSVTSGSGATQTGNITPMTHLLVSYLRNVPGMSAADPAAWFALATTRGLLADTPALTLRITRDFIPTLKAMLPSLSLADGGFLFTAFTAGSTSASSDVDLEKLKTGLIVKSTGEPSDDTAAKLKTGASDDKPEVAPTGATGAGS